MFIKDNILAIGLHESGIERFKSLVDRIEPEKPKQRAGIRSKQFVDRASCFNGLLFTLKDSIAPSRHYNIQYRTGLYQNVPLPTGLDNVDVWTKYISIYDQLLRENINDEINRSLEKMDSAKCVSVIRDPCVGIAGSSGSRLLMDLKDVHNCKRAIDIWSTPFPSITPIPLLNHLLSYATAYDVADATINLNDIQGTNDKNSHDLFLNCLYTPSIYPRCNIDVDTKPLTLDTMIEILQRSCNRPAIQPFVIEDRGNKRGGTEVEVELKKLICHQSTHGLQREVVLSLLSTNIVASKIRYHSMKNHSMPILRGGTLDKKSSEPNNITFFGGITSQYYQYVAKQKAIENTSKLIKNKAFLHHFDDGAMSGEDLFDEILATLE